MQQVNPPNLSYVFSVHKRNIQTSINCVQVGEIKSFDHENQTATIQIAMKQLVETKPDLTKVYSEYPIIMRCPVFVLFGGVDFMSMPIEPGDSCIVLFNDRSLGNWMNTGQNVPPTLPHYHDLTDAIALVGIRPLTNSIATYLSNGIRMSHGNGSSRVDLTDALITSVASLFYHHGSMRVSENMQVDGNLTILGDTYGNGSGNLTLKANLVQQAGKSIHAGNGATGTFHVVTVVDGIVTGGSNP